MRFFLGSSHRAAERNESERGREFQSPRFHLSSECLLDLVRPRLYFLLAALEGLRRHYDVDEMTPYPVGRRVGRAER